jgi:hypothetical protein
MEQQQQGQKLNLSEGEAKTEVKTAQMFLIFVCTMVTIMYFLSDEVVFEHWLDTIEWCAYTVIGGLILGRTALKGLKVLKR